MRNRNVVARECNWLPKRYSGGSCGSSRRNMWASETVPQNMQGKSGNELVSAFKENTAGIQCGARRRPKRKKKKLSELNLARPEDVSSGRPTTLRVDRFGQTSTRRCARECHLSQVEPARGQTVAKPPASSIHVTGKAKGPAPLHWPRGLCLCPRPSAVVWTEGPNLPPSVAVEGHSGTAPGRVMVPVAQHQPAKRPRTRVGAAIAAAGSHERRTATHF